MGGVCDSCGSCVGAHGWGQEAGHCRTTEYIHLDAMTRCSVLVILEFCVRIPPGFTSQTSHIPRYDK